MLLMGPMIMSKNVNTSFFKFFLRRWADGRLLETGFLKLSEGPQFFFYNSNKLISDGCCQIPVLT